MCSRWPSPFGPVHRESSEQQLTPNWKAIAKTNAHVQFQTEIQRRGVLNTSHNYIIATYKADKINEVLDRGQILKQHRNGGARILVALVTFT